MPISESGRFGFISIPSFPKMASPRPYLATAITLTQDLIGFQAKL
jgi:hypothetical protein